MNGYGARLERLAGVYGWYSNACQHPAAPDHDPPHDAPCPYCGAQLADDDVRTHSFVTREAGPDDRSWFYRTHRSCDVSAGPAARQAVFELVLERIAHDTGETP